MSIGKQAKGVLKDLLLGKIRPPLKFFLGQDGPQQEVSVWLHGMGIPIDVTNHHALACAVPLIICVAFKNGTLLAERNLRGLSLRFCEKDGDRQLLGRIGLQYSGISILTNGPVLYFFRVSNARSYCLPIFHLWMSYFLLAYKNWRTPLAPNTMAISFLGMRAMDILFSCPRPIALGSVEQGNFGNMFPMNVMGDLDAGYFGFGLQNAKSPSHLVAEAKRIALSTVPMQYGDLAYRLGRNHSIEKGIEWCELPFATKPSSKFGIPVPEFSIRVREIEVEAMQKFGSHNFFIGRVVKDERSTQNTEWCVVQGHYQTWRLKTRPNEVESSMAEDSRIKSGTHSSNVLI